MKDVDARQSIFRGTLQQLDPYAPSQTTDRVYSADQTVDKLLSAIDTDLTVPLNVTASNPASLMVHVGSDLIANPVSLRNRSISFINGLIPVFTSGTVTFPTTINGGSSISQNTSGTTYPLTSTLLPSSNYVQVLLSLDQTGKIVATVGVSGVSPSAALVPAPVLDTLPFSYVTVHNSGGTLDTIAQSFIFQFSNPTLFPTINNSQLAQMAPDTLQGNNTGSTTNPSALTVAQVKDMLNIPSTIDLTGAVTGSSSVVFGTTTINTTAAALNISQSGSTTTVGTTTSSTPVELINTLLSITTTGRKVWIGCIPDGSGNDAFFEIINGAVVQATVYAFIYRDGVEIGRFPLRNNAGVNSGNSTDNSNGVIAIPVSTIQTIDFGATAGGHTYAVWISAPDIGISTCNLFYARLVAYEL
jgi:hypothetical protein